MRVVLVAVRTVVQRQEAEHHHRMVHTNRAVEVEAEAVAVAHHNTHNIRSIRSIRSIRPAHEVLRTNRAAVVVVLQLILRLGKFYIQSTQIKRAY